MFLRGSRVLLIGAGACIALAFPSLASAATFQVVTDASGGPGSLSEAVDQANAAADPSNTVEINDLGPAATISPSAPLVIGPNDISIEGPGLDRLAIDLASSGFSSTDSGISLSGVTLRGANSTQPGAVVRTGAGPIALDRVEVTDNTVRAHQSDFQGGLISSDSGTVQITDTRLTENEIFNGVTGNPASIVFRGGIVNSGSGEITATRSSFAFNQTVMRVTGIAPPFAALQGSVLAASQPIELNASAVVANTAVAESTGQLGLDGTVFLGSGGQVVNSTFSQNGLSSSQSAPSNGSGIYNAGALTVLHGTLVRNYGGTSANTSANLYTEPSAQATLDNTLVAVSGLGCVGPTVSAGHNYDDDGSCNLDQPTDLPDTPGYVGYFSLHSGQGTEVVDLGAQSPAIDAGSAGGLSTDQIGDPRTIQSPYPDPPGSDGTDIGALEGGTGSFPRCQGQAVTIANRSGEPLVGTPGPDVLYGYGSIDGGAGDDIICGYGNRTQIYGGPGNDRINGGAYAESLRGGSGDDILRGLAGRDKVRGSGGDDLLYGGDDDDNLYGGPGQDGCRGGNGIDNKTSCELRQQ